ncbi:M16 family metallopeptidase [Tabrizicola oligotrophica]|uniref:Insulinase family protein n=1 Tax=Tabrizicola oligotrophica TaxID=2710650 RepID=A0A6M0QRX9_9RHOB|nr:pitrilysin family protein [Tabrizicola oligotrophica]NEY90176.1 insulinase family protein [Tabrizicola oligotrophica]
MILRIALFLVALATPLRAEIAIQEVTSPGGIKAWLVEDHNIPFMALELRFRGGTSLDQPGKRGAINLMAATLEEGAGEMDAQGFAAARDGLAAKIGFGAGSDEISVSAQTLTENRDTTMGLLHLALTAPRFDQDAVERVKGQVLAGLRAEEQDPSAIAARLARARAYGDQPYGSSGDGTIEGVTSLTRDDVLAAWQGAMAQDRLYVAAAGDISAAELGLLLDKLLSDLPATGWPMPPKAALDEKPGVVVQAFPGPQSVVLFGHGGIGFDDPDFFAASLLNDILGGGRFSSRLMQEVREKRGLTYGIGTGLASRDLSAEWVGQFQASNDKVAEAIKVVRDEWARMASEGVTEQELATAKTYMTGAYPLRFDGNGPIASILVGMQMLGLSSDYPKTRNDKVNAVTMQDIRRVAARLLKPENLSFVVVGEPAGVVATE